MMVTWGSDSTSRRDGGRRRNGMKRLTIIARNLCFIAWSQRASDKRAKGAGIRPVYESLLLSLFSGVSGQAKAAEIRVGWGD
jgi:hypothetical protein